MVRTPGCIYSFIDHVPQNVHALHDLCCLAPGLVLDENGQAMPSIPVAFSYSTAQQYFVGPEFTWRPPKHDRKHFGDSGAAAKIPQDTTVGGDCGYQGIQADLPDHSVITPFKKSKHHPLSEEQKLLNQEFSRGRIIVENTLCQFKHFGVLAQRFRHDVDQYDDAFRSVLAIVNPRIQKRVAAAMV